MGSVRIKLSRYVAMKQELAQLRERDRLRDDIESIVAQHKLQLDLWADWAQRVRELEKFGADTIRQLSEIEKRLALLEDPESKLKGWECPTHKCGSLSDWYDGENRCWIALCEMCNRYWIKLAGEEWRLMTSQEEERRYTQVQNAEAVAP